MMIPQARASAFLLRSSALHGAAALRCSVPLIAAATAITLLTSCRPAETSDAPEPREQLADSIRRSLESDLLDAWYPRVVDVDYGGFLSDFDENWEPTGSQEKFIVTQARHVWTLSRAADFLPERRSDYLTAAEQGVAFLREKMWDNEYGGYVSLVTREGGPADGGNTFTRTKTAYGNAFALYALAAYADVTRDSMTLQLAKEAFGWMDEHMHDPEYGGYFQFVERDGTPMREGLDGTPPKDQNSSIHLLEAFTELYHVWPDSVLGDRLEEMLVLVRDSMTQNAAYLALFFQQDWTPISHRDSSEAFIRENLGRDHVSFGHDVETAYLMLEAAQALGLDTTPTLAVGKRMVDHALDHGWDEEEGGFFDGAYYFEPGGPPEVVNDSKAWWAQAEGLNTLLVMDQQFPDDEGAYYERFEMMWTYIQRHLIDHERGGWYLGGLDRDPERRSDPKAGIWKGAYHDARALMNVVAMLSGDAG